MQHMPELSKAYCDLREAEPGMEYSPNILIVIGLVGAEWIKADVDSSGVPSSSSQSAWVLQG